MTIQTGLDPAAYADPAAFRAEVSRLFERCWLLVGMTDHLKNRNDYVTMEVPGTSLFVHNFDGTLRALHNVCAHRFAPIHRDHRGNRLPRCLYHGWTYNRDGVPVGIPGNDAHFHLDRAARRNLALRQFAVDICGRFVFVRIAPDGPNLAEYLGEYATVLEHLSEAFPIAFDEAIMPWACNWKHALEVVLEVYHVDAVHPESFGQFAGQGWDCSYVGRHSRGIAPLSEASRRWWLGIAAKTGLATSPLHRDYDHFFLFPNVAIGVTEGGMMSVQAYMPQDETRSQLRYQLFMAEAPAPSARTTAMLRAVQEQVRSFNRRVLEEDRQVCEWTHDGTKQSGRPAVLGDNEERILAFHRAYRDALNADGSV